MKKIINWLQKNKLEVIFLLIILLIAGFLRFYKISEVFYFIGDAGRDAQAAYKILFDHKLTLIGPRASVAGFFLGPFYFYLITVPLFLFGMDPIGLGYFSSFLGVLAVGLFYFLSRNLFAKKTALFIAFFYSISFIVINYSRTAWNPSPIPICTILLLYCIFKMASRKNDKKWIIFSWIIIGLGVQLHFVFFYIIPSFLIFSFFLNKNTRNYFISSVIGLFLFLLLNSSLIIFDLRHNFITSNAFFGFLLSDKVSFNFSAFLSTYWQHLRQIFDLILFPGFLVSPKAVILLFLSIVIIFLSKEKKVGFLIVGMFLGSILFFSFFKGTTQLYYYTFLLPFPFLVLGYVFDFFSKRKLFFGGMLFVFSFFFIRSNFYLDFYPPNPPRSLIQIRNITASIIEKVPKNSNFNIAFFSSEPWYSAEEFRYFSYYFGERAKGAEDYRNIDKLYVISVEPKDNPLLIRSQETDDFGATKIDASWKTNDVWVYELSK